MKTEIKYCELILNKNVNNNRLASNKNNQIHSTSTNVANEQGNKNM